MKTTKKIFALMLALMLALSMTKIRRRQQLLRRQRKAIQQQIPAVNPVRNSRSVSVSWFSMRLLMQQHRALLTK